ncbi:MAG: hypothetical protein RR552_03595 [Oscillospiraceae bacterium]
MDVKIAFNNRRKACLFVGTLFAVYKIILKERKEGTENQKNNLITYISF